MTPPLTPEQADIVKALLQAAIRVANNDGSTSADKDTAMALVSSAVEIMDVESSNE